MQLKLIYIQYFARQSMRKGLQYSTTTHPGYGEQGIGVLNCVDFAVNVISARIALKCRT